MESSVVRELQYKIHQQLFLIYIFIQFITLRQSAVLKLLSFSAFSMLKKKKFSILISIQLLFFFPASSPYPYQTLVQCLPTLFCLCVVSRSLGAFSVLIHFPTHLQGSGGQWCWTEQRLLWMKWWHYSVFVCVCGSTQPSCARASEAFVHKLKGCNGSAQSEQWEYNYFKQGQHQMADFHPAPREQGDRWTTIHSPQGFTHTLTHPHTLRWWRVMTDWKCREQGVWGVDSSQFCSLTSTLVCFFHLN